MYPLGSLIINTSNNLELCLFTPKKKQKQQESIPEECVPPACQPQCFGAHQMSVAVGGGSSSEEV